MRGTTSEDAFKAYLEGQRLFSVVSRERMDESRRKFAEATKLDGNFARAWGHLSYAYVRSVLAGFMEDDVLMAAEELARKAVKLDQHDYANHWDLAFVYLNTRRFDEALEEYRTALNLYENHTDMLDRKHGLIAEMAEAFIYVGEPGTAIEFLKRAKRYPDWYRWNLGWAYYHTKGYDEALQELEGMERKPGDPSYVIDVQLFIAAAYAQKGDKAKAKAALDLFLASRDGPYTIQDVKKRGHFKNEEDEEHWLNGLREAGLPEGDDAGPTAAPARRKKPQRKRSERRSK